MDYGNTNIPCIHHSDEIINLMIVVAQWKQKKKKLIENKYTIHKLLLTVTGKSVFKKKINTQFTFFVWCLVVVVFFSSLVKVLGECLTIHSLPVLFFF